MTVNFENKNVAVLGWGINGLDAVNYLLDQNAKVTILDAKPKEELDLDGIDLKKVSLKLESDYLQNLEEFDYIFRTPGVYRFIPQLLSAEKKGVKVTSSIKLFFDLCPAKIIGVTGTKGKGTTSTLIYEILRYAGKNVYLAGNIGYPVLKLLPVLNERSWVVLELSSFQLMDMNKSPHISVVLNITSDHMDWHKNRDEYIDAKKEIVKHQIEGDYCVLNYDYKDSKSFSKFAKSKVYYFSRYGKVSGSYVENKNIYLNVDDKNNIICSTGDLTLRGEHNWENICAAVCASSLAGADNDSISKTVIGFKGLVHRLEFVRKVNGINYYNDSFSTNPQTTIAAVKSFDEPLTLILGGSDKGLEYNEMASELANSKNIKSIILIGDISDKIFSSFQNARVSCEIIKMGKPEMKNIIDKANSVTKKGGVVLLSPSTASFDMFKSYKDRGDQFKRVVNDL